MAQRIWLVTGCSSGFGEQFIKHILQRGDKAIATARRVESLKELETLGAATLQLDVSETQIAMDEKIKTAWSKYGHIDVLVQNAGYGAIGALEDLGDGRLENQFKTNVFGVANLTRVIMPYFRAQKSGQIVLISSVASWLSTPAFGAYVASKAGVEGLFRSFNEETKDTGIKTLIIQPGRFRTEVANPQKTDFGTSEHNQHLLDTFKARMKTGHGTQNGDPGKLADVVIDLVKGEGCAEGRERIPLNLPLGSDALQMVRSRLEQELETLQEWENVIKSTDYETQ